MTNKKATIKSISDKTGLSLTTVSRVLSGVGKKYRISDKTIELVSAVAKEQLYTPNSIAKSLRLKKTQTLGLIVPDISNPWFSNITMKIESESRNKDYNIFLCNSAEDVNIEISSIKLLENWNVDGIIVAPIGLEYGHLNESFKRGMPMVLVDRFFKEVTIPYVSTDDFEGAYKATEYLIQNGHRKIACIQGVVGTSTNNQRVGGYRKVLLDNEIEISEDIIIGSNFGFQNGYTKAKALINKIKTKELTAIFSTGNQITIGILKAFKEEQIKVPEDVSIVSFDEQDYSDLLYTPLSTISHGRENLGKMALKLLLDQIDNKNIKDLENILLPTQLIKRESVKNLTL